MSEKKKLYAYSAANGCLTNLLETTSFRNSLDQNSYDQVASAEESDVIFINTCGYNNEAEARSLNVIEEFQNKYPNKKVIVSGCLPRINKTAIQKKFSGPIVPTGELHKMNELLGETIIQKSGLADQAYHIDEKELQTRLSSNLIVEKMHPVLKKTENFFSRKFGLLSNIFESASFDEKTFAISVSTGCLGKCNYCAIKKAKGRLISRPLPKIVEQINGALANGANKIHLLGDDIGCWGQDLNLNSSHLLSAILRLNYDFKIVINYFDPTWLVRYFDDLAPLLSNPKVICVNIPLQSGNNDIVKKMDREYDTKLVLEQVRTLKTLNPSLVVKTHIMVGYPTESNFEFFDSLKIIKDFDLIFPNKYGIRPGTPAEKMVQVPEPIKNVRFFILRSYILLRHALVFVSSLGRSTKTQINRISYES